MKSIPFEAAIFDLDGTLLDSMYVWKRVDEKFFAARGKRVPEDYAVAIAGLSYRETAEYTVEHYLPEENPQTLIEEWTRLSEYEYDNNVPLKPFSLDYLRMLKREGVKLGIATALTPRLYTTCLQRLNIMELFDAVCSTEHTGGRGKQSGEVYRLAAEKLGVAPENCAVFEDVLAGIEGAHAVGMRAYCVREPHSAKDFTELGAQSDFIMDTLEEMRAVHTFPENRRCVIFTAYFEGDLKSCYDARESDYILCADAGWTLAKDIGVRADRVLGDFDTGEAPDKGCVDRFPWMKDDTDTGLCLRYAMAMGYEDILILGGMGGRLDHTLSNIQSMTKAAKENVRIEMRDGNASVWVLHERALTVPKRAGKLSVFALGESAEGVDITGTLWPLSGETLTHDFPLGVSNVITAEEARISVSKGTLLVMVTDDRI